MDEIAYTPTTGVSAVCETPLILASDDNLAGYGWLWPPCRPHPVARGLYQGRDPPSPGVGAELG